MSQEGVRRTEMKETFTSTRGAGPDPFSKLLDECTTHIFTFLPSPRDRCSCAAVSRKWLILQALMRPSDFRHLSTAPDLFSPPGGRDNGNDGQRGVKGSRFLSFQSASDARLAAMAVGACVPQGPIASLTVRADFFVGPSDSTSLLRVTDRGLKFASLSFPELRHLSLLGCVAVGDEGIAAIAGGCPLLEQLYLSNAPRIGDAGIVSVAMNCTKLSVLTLHMCRRVGDGALHAFAQCSSNIESISLDDCPLMGDAGLADVISSAPRLAKLAIAFMNVGNAALEAVAARGEDSPALSLSLENVSGFTHLGFCRLVKAGKLQALSVRCCAGLDDVAFSAVGGASGSRPPAGTTVLVGLRRVAVRNCEGFTDAGLVVLSETARQLASLRLEKCHSVTTRGITVALRNLSATLKLLSLVRCNGMGTPQQQEEEEEVQQGTDLFLKRSANLQTLVIKNCRWVGDEFLSLVGRALGRAKRIELVGMRGVTDRGFVSLLTSMSRNDALSVVELSRCRRITDWSVVALAGASGKSLIRLTLRGCARVTDRSLQVMGLLCPVLDELDLTGCRKVGDGGVAGLLGRGEGFAWALAPRAQQVGGGGGGARKSRLEMLSLEGCEGVTDTSLRSLAELAVHGNLEWVNLKDCAGVSPGGIEAVRRAFSWCDFQH